MSKNNPKEFLKGSCIVSDSRILGEGMKHKLKRKSKLAALILSMTCLMTPNLSAAQQITLSVKEGSLEQILKEIRKQSGYNFFLNADLLKKSKSITINTKNQPIRNVLDEVFGQLPLDYKIEGKSIVVQSKFNIVHQNNFSNSVQQSIIGGRVTDDATGKYIVGATVQILPSGATVMTDEKGVFQLDIKEGDNKLLVSYIGMEPRTVNLPNYNFIDIKLKAVETNIEDVVVTGLFNKSKESFTGASQSFTGEQLKAIAPTSVIEALTMLTPGLVQLENNSAGSNPNRVPDILIRGVTSFSNADQSVNLPLIVRDGTIVTIQDLYDMDINEIQSITILKDASAAALYGAKAANGVIVIERKKIQEGKMRVAYNLISSLQFPDFRDYNLLNPTQKLEFERLGGLYESSNISEQYSLDSLYNEKYKEIQRGVNTDWMSIPSRIGSTHDHSVRLFGGSNNTRYEINGRYADVKGVMKGDYRRRFGLGFVLEYYTPQGFSFNNRTTLNRTESKASPYGAFSQYTQLNPYDRLYDEFGELRTVLSWNMNNPLYEATLGSFNTNKSQLISNDFDARWNINNNFRLTTHWNISLNQDNADNYTSPLSGAYRFETDLTRRGSYSKSNLEGLTYSGNVVLSYNKTLKDKHLLMSNVGGTVTRMDLRTAAFRGIGFYAEDMDFINFAATYPTGERPTGSQDLNADVGGFLNLNYSYDNRYYLDGVYQISGSSKFGANNRYGHFWSSGIGWNLHNESFVNKEVFDLLKLRGSMGFTGKVSFNSYQALTTYRYGQNLFYLNGIGAVPIAIGNSDLKWERTMNYNIGTDVSLFNRRFNVVADFYLRKTTDLLVDRSLAPSTGMSTGKDNLGEMENKGVEVRMDAFAIKNQKWSWQIGTILSHNANKIVKISSALQRQNDINNSVSSTSPLPQFEEGQSTTALKVVQSGGIDPATGQEIFIKRNGDRTFVYDPADKIVVGDQLPKISGNVFTTVRYNNFSMAAYFGVRNGGYVYNVTRSTKVEGVNPMYNADERVFFDRWKTPGDIADYRDIKDQTAPRHTTRFVEKDNTLSLDRLNFAYDFDSNLAKKIGANKIAFGMSMNDVFRLSTVRMERGTSYLYSRGVDFNINILF
ncbi:MAG: SusC/RagA family TonB-linked outer membrane protein [Sphingobacterium composti]|uniref:SusC/RagA family TonB-linked outer membrane protein n=1 Tax=Sphingobacterium composti TaxID=363260 RepID=UPI001356E4A0|nr:SusC/RagA family TonB-linked outer membrane protein [Sphingobacterium composti Ten et al. 2007 non Yoo et al. 2007]